MKILLTEESPITGMVLPLNSGRFQVGNGLFYCFFLFFVSFNVLCIVIIIFINITIDSILRHYLFPWLWVRKEDRKSYVLLS